MNSPSKVQIESTILNLTVLDLSRVERTNVEEGCRVGRPERRLALLD